jgi:acyl-CoA thioester hydrolase
MHALLAGFPVVVHIPVAWGEMDAYQHVNNIVYFRYFETARIHYFQKVGFDQASHGSVGPILASTRCRFRFPVTFPDIVSVGARVARMDEDRFTMEYRVVSERAEKVAAEGEGVIVSYHYDEGRKTEIPAALRAAIEALEASTATA